METGKISNLVPLNEKNYPTWKVQVKMHLMKDELLGIVEGTETFPTADDSAERLH